MGTVPVYSERDKLLPCLLIEVVGRGNGTRPKDLGASRAIISCGNGLAQELMEEKERGNGRQYSFLLVSVQLSR